MPELFETEYEPEACPGSEITRSGALLPFPVAMEQCRMKTGLYKAGLAACTLIALALSPAALLSETKTVAAGAQWVRGEDHLAFGIDDWRRRGRYSSGGNQLTLTVNGIETAIAPGNYKGDVVLTLAKDLVIHFDEMNMTSDLKYRQAIYVKDGAYLPEQSVASAVKGGKFTDQWPTTSASPRTPRSSMA